MSDAEIMREMEVRGFEKSVVEDFDCGIANRDECILMLKADDDEQ